MALARLALRNYLHQRVLSSPSSAAAAAALMLGDRAAVNGGTQFDTKRFFSTEGTDKVAVETPDGKRVAASDDQGKKSRSLFRRRSRDRGVWRRSPDRDFIPAEIFEFFPSGLGNALIQATENVNKLFENLNLSPWSLSGRVKEEEDRYKLRFDVPGLSKEDLKITVHDGILTIKGEHKEEEEEEGSEEESRAYKYYYTSLVLPEDAKTDEVKAELKHGVLALTIPRTEKPKKDVKEVQIH